MQSQKSLYNVSSSLNAQLGAAEKYYKDLRSQASRYIMADTKQFGIAIFQRN